MKDMMPNFNLVQPADLATAISTLADAGENGWAMAGGQDSRDWFKDRIKRPTTVVDLSGIPGLTGVTETADAGVEIGARTTQPDVENNNAILDELETFADAINNNTTPIVSLEQGTEALRVAQMIIDCF